MKETTIKLSQKFKNWLQSKGNKGETFEDVIKRLMNYNTITKEDKTQDGK